MLTPARFSPIGAVRRVESHVRAPLTRNGYALVFSSVTTSGLGALYWTLAARSYPADVVGRNAATIAAMMFVAGVSQLNLMSALVRFVPGAGRATTALVVGAYAIAAAVAGVVSLLFLAGPTAWAPGLGFLRATPVLVLWFTLATMAWCIFVLQDSVLTGLRQAVWVPVENTVFALTKIVLLLAFVRSLPDFGIFASWTAALAASLVPTNILLFWRLIPKHVRETHGRASRLVPTEVLTFVPGDYVGALCWLAATTLLPVLVSDAAGAAPAAYFFLAWQIALLLHAISPSLGASLVVEAATDQSTLRVGARRVLTHSALLVVPAAAIVVVGAPYLLSVFGDDYVAEGTPLLRLLALAALPNMVTSLAVSTARAQRRISAVVLVLALLCVLSLGLSYVLVRTHGITGVGIAWLVSQSTVAAVAWVTQLRPLGAASSPGDAPLRAG
ncbi:MAG TPA: teichoic acid transporter [Chloroflexota bacterium]|nr:teichoic acid transporter [Chloroflexota bacterium]